MSHSVDCFALQTTLQELTDFLGQTYTTTCKEVARAEYAVQADLRILRDLEVLLASYNEGADHNDTGTEPAAAHEATRVSGVPENAGEPAKSTSSTHAQHDKLQAVLAQARAIRGQLKPQTTSAAEPQRKPVKAGLVNHRQPSRPISRPSVSRRATSTHNRTNSHHTVTESSTSKGSNNSKPVDLAPPAGKSSTAQQAQQRMSAEPATTPDSSAGSTSGLHLGGHKKASSCPLPMQLPADFRKAVNALRQPATQQQTQSAASARQSSPATSMAPFINLMDTYNESMASITADGKVFQEALRVCDAQCDVSPDILQSWADPHAQSWLRHSALVEAQLLLMQRLSSQLGTPSSHGPDDEQWQDVLQLWQEVQQEYQALFESPAGDPDAVMRWRNRALRFVLASDSDLPACHKLDAPTGLAAQKSEEAWLPKACWAGLAQTAGNGATSSTAGEPHNLLLPPVLTEDNARSTAMQYTDVAQLQTISRLQHQLQLYLLQQHIESMLAVKLLPSTDSVESAMAAGGVEAQQALAKLRLAHAFLGKGAEQGPCTITQEVLQ